MARPRGETRNANRRHRAWMAAFRAGTLKVKPPRRAGIDSMTFMERFATPIRPTRHKEVKS